MKFRVTLPQESNNVFFFVNASLHKRFEVASQILAVHRSHDVKGTG